MTQSQREAIFDFLLLAIFSDSSIKLIEDERLHEMIAGLGWEGSRDPEEYGQLATARVRDALASDDKTDQFLGDLSDRLSDAETRKIALGLFSELTQIDQVAAAELQLLSRARAIFGV